MREITLAEFLQLHENGFLSEVYFADAKVYAHSVKGQADNPARYETVWADNPGLIKLSNPSWVELTGGGATTLHSHAGSGGSVPIGAILLWSGLLSNMPGGYQLCDGTNSTPDLRSKFVKGAAAAQNPGGTGGGTTYGHAGGAVNAHSGAGVDAHSAHSGAGVDAHSAHSVTQPTAHTVVATKQGSSAGNVVTTATHTGTAVAVHSNHVFTQAAAHAAHVFTQAVNHVFTQPSDHTDVEPFYYAMAFIMRMT